MTLVEPPAKKISTEKMMIEPHFPQILAAMQKELAASGLSPEEILAKTLLLQVTFFAVVVASGNFFVVLVRAILENNIMQLR